MFCSCVCVGFGLLRERRENRVKEREREREQSVGSSCQRRRMRLSRRQYKLGLSTAPMDPCNVLCVLWYSYINCITCIGLSLFTLQMIVILVIRGVPNLSLCIECFGLFKLPTVGTLQKGQGHSTCFWSPDTCV